MLDSRLPAPFARELAADDNEGFTIALLTVADGGWPHQALISVGEIVAFDDVRLRLATWPASTATRNLLATGRATLVAVVDAEVFAVRVEVAPARAGWSCRCSTGASSRPAPTPRRTRRSSPASGSGCTTPRP
ncbi:hypothetical protein ACFQV8_32695 [Pseudonocardia benzenivorans]